MTVIRTLLAVPTALALTVGVAPTVQATPYWDGVYEGQGAMVSYANEMGWTLPIPGNDWDGTDRVTVCADLFAQRYPAGSHKFPADWYNDPGGAIKAANYRNGFVSGCVHTSLGKTP